jgi:uncharacterized membrane protein
VASSGFVLLMIGQVSVALSVLCLKRIPRAGESLNSGQLALVSLFIATLVCALALPVLNQTSGGGTPLARYSSRQLAWLIASGVLLGVFQVFFVAAVGRLSTLVLALAPAVYTALLIGLSFLALPAKPHVNWEFWAACLLITVGFVWLAVRYADAV